MPKNDKDAAKESIDNDIKVNTVGGLVRVRELMSKVHEEVLETVKGLCMNVHVPYYLLSLASKEVKTGMEV